MTISVKEPESGIELQLEVRLLEPEHRSKWSVTLPKGEIIIFRLVDENWIMLPEKRLSHEFAKVICHVIGLLSVHQEAAKDLDKFFREPRLRARKY